MIGVDTNVLLRLFIQDDPNQNALVTEFFANRSTGDPAHISLVVIVELVWALGQAYKYGRDRISLVLERMLDTADIVVEAHDVVREALPHYANSKVDLADLLIAEINRRSGCTTTVTFDKDAAKRIPGMELLA
ncbi:Predicted nucleic-acid-binding protein, contains PIN domain [Devosia sp. YR412]|uniref:PIN domain-containing protein n=1 Tax=Devosia sp. YR412 TaxID=1881030 RepID=UPI0008BC9CD3|nr:type II toxin-antitoxin system VapC family toxin [Devosia sp. YR412]SEQ12878.1 Predicted nucleic-acid-binding protein, contains PIN domain [Devosia sp. YR412]